MRRTTLKKFAASEEGAVTVDWVVLTAAVCTLAATIVLSINGATGNVGDTAGSNLDLIDVERFGG